LRILIYSFDFHPCPGGVDTYVRQLINGMRKRGHTVDFLCSSHIRFLPGEVQSAIAAYQTNLELIQLPAAVKRIEYLKYANELLVNSIDLHHYDLVHSNNGVTSYVINKIAPQIPLIGTVHGIYYEEALANGWVSTKEEAELMGIYDQYAVNCPDIVHMASHDMLQRVPVMDNKRHVVIHHGLQLDEFQPTYLNNETVRMACSGMLTSRKGYDILMDALIMLKDEDVEGYEVVIYGDGPAKDELLQTVQRHQLPVSFRGMVAPEILRKELPGFDIFIHPSRYESFGLSVTEALASGCAVICSNTGGLKDQITHEHNGLLFEVGDARQLANSIRRLLDEVDLRTQLRRNGVITAQTHFSEHKMLDQYEQLYAEAISLKNWRGIQS